VNVVNSEAIMEITAALEQLKTDDTTRVVIIRGAGNKAFAPALK